MVYIMFVILFSAETEMFKKLWHFQMKANFLHTRIYEWKFCYLTKKLETYCFL